MDKNKATTRRILELIALAAIVACIALVLVELAGNVRGELRGDAWSTPPLTAPGRCDAAPELASPHA